MPITIRGDRETGFGPAQDGYTRLVGLGQHRGTPLNFSPKNVLKRGAGIDGVAKLHEVGLECHGRHQEGTVFNHCIQRIVVHQRGVNDLVKAGLTSHLD